MKVQSDDKGIAPGRKDKTLVYQVTSRSLPLRSSLFDSVNKVQFDLGPNLRSWDSTFYVAI